MGRTWTDDSGIPINAANLNGMEADIATAQSAAVSARAVADSATTRNLTQDSKLTEHETRVSALEVLGGIAPGSLSDSTVADLVGNSSSNTVAALALKFVGKGEVVVNALDWGVKGDNTTDDTAALNAAAAQAFSISPEATLYLPPKAYKITGKVMVKCNLQASGATLNYYGTGTALVIGDDTSTGLVTFDGYFFLPEVINKSRTGTTWDGTSVGVKLVNLNTCSVWNRHIENFERGLVAFGQGAGCAYNEIVVGRLYDNHANLVCDADATGWSNENNYYGGRFYHRTTGLVGDVNSLHILIPPLSGSISAGNNNVFYKPSLEGNSTEYYRVAIAGRYNRIVNARWESSSGVTPRIHWLTGASSNIVEYGYDAFKIEEVFDTGVTGGIILDGTSAMTASNTAGQVIPNKVGSTWTPITTWSTAGLSRIDASAVATNGQFKPRPGKWRIEATVSFSANATGTRTARILAGGSTVSVNQVAGSTVVTPMKLSSTYSFDGVKTFEIDVQQDSGADLALFPSTPYVRLEAEYIGKF